MHACTHACTQTHKHIAMHMYIYIYIYTQARGNRVSYQINIECRIFYRTDFEFLFAFDNVSPQTEYRVIGRGELLNGLRIEGLTVASSGKIASSGAAASSVAIASSGKDAVENTSLVEQAQPRGFF